MVIKKKKEGLENEIKVPRAAAVQRKKIQIFLQICMLPGRAPQNHKHEFWSCYYSSRTVDFINERTATYILARKEVHIRKLTS